MKVSVVGFGHVGSVISAVLADKGFNVIGIEKNAELINSFNKGLSPINEPGLQNLVSKNIKRKTLKLVSDISYVKKTDVIIITVGTPLNKKYKPNLKQLINTCYEMKKFLKSKQIICIKSTVPPGTTRNIISKIFNKKNVYLSFCPERFSEGTAIKEFKTLPIIIGGISKIATNQADKFWKKALKIKTIKVLNSETAEYVKLATNAWIDLNIAYANDLARLSDVLDSKIDILEVIKASNSLRKGNNYVNILTPSIGVGGYCLTKDPWFVYSIGKSNKLDLKTIKAGRNSNDIMPDYAASKILNYLKLKKIKKTNAKIGILGLSFKTNSGDIRYSPVIPFIKKLKKHNIKNILVYDPLVTKKDQKTIKVETINNYKNVIENADCIIFCTAHDQIVKISNNFIVKNVNKNAFILDGRRYFSRKEIDIFEKNGLKYSGIGR